MEVYLDNSATTKAYKEVAEIVTKTMLEDYGNPSSMHLKGVDAEKYVKYSQEVLAKALKVLPKEIFFTSGGTESDNWALRGTAYANARAGKHLITTKIEHPAVLQTMEQLEKEGFEVTYLPVDGKGLVCLADLEKAIRKDTILVSMMFVNNEVGAIEPIEQAGKLIKQINPKILFHVDAVQGFGKKKLYPKKCGVDMMSVSGHKIHGPKGVGFLYIDEKVKIKPIIFGGGQQKGFRSGTDNVPGIAGIGKACEIMYQNFDKDIEKLYCLKRYFVGEMERLERVYVNGPQDETGAPHIVSVSFQGVRSEVLLHALEDRGVYVSAGSACSTHKHTVSATLSSMKIAPDLMDSTLRFSFSVFTTKEEVEYCVKCIYELLPMLRKYTRQ